MGEKRVKSLNWVRNVKTVGKRTGVSISSWSEVIKGYAGYQKGTERNRNEGKSGNVGSKII